MRALPQFIALGIAAMLAACSVDGGPFKELPVTIGGTITGLAGTGLVLTNNGGDDLPISGDGAFEFTNQLEHGASYDVVVKSQPSNPTQMCSVTNGTSNAGDANVTDVQVICHTMSFSVGGTVTGLAGSGLVLQNNGGDDLSVNADGTFTFATPVLSKGTYGVTVKTQSTMPWQTCAVTANSGIVTNANVTGVVVTCTTNRYRIGGTLSGLGTGDLITLRDNGGDDLVLSGDGNFAFPAQVTSGQPYAVTIVANPTSPISQTCTVTSGAGLVAGSDITGVQVTCTTDGFTIGGTVTGLAGTGLVLQNNGGDDLSITADGAFMFTAPVASGTGYDVTIVAQPSLPTQVCTVTNGSGTVGASSVTNIDVTCVTSTFTIGGTVTGLVGSGLVLQDNGGDDLRIGADGSFTFATPIASGSTFAVTVLTQPAAPTQTCTVSGGTGTVGAGNVTSVAINCTTNRYLIGGTISGLAGTVTLQNNGSDNLDLTSNGTFAFATPVPSGATYSVTVKTQPSAPSQTCRVTAGSGMVTNANVTSVSVTCTTNRFRIGGTLAGLATGNSITLRNNGGDDLVRSANGSFTFPTPVASDQPYAVTIVANPPPPISQTCTVTNGTGVVASSDITDVQVVCTIDQRCGNGIVESGEQCDDGNTVNGDGCDSTCTISAETYIKASNTGAVDLFGHSIALSADGSTLAVGSVVEDSAATGINGNQADNSAPDSGAVYVFTRSGTTWAQQAYIKASNTGASDEFGFSVALSADGSTLAVGAVLESSAATGINGNQADNSATNSGAVYVFTRSGTTWSQQAYVKASNTGSGDEFGFSVALSGNGSTLAVGALVESSAATGINGNQADNAAGASGAVYAFVRSGTTWSQQAYVKASNTGAGDAFGRSVALSVDGSTLAVGALGEASAATGINGNQGDNSAGNAGAVYVFARSGTTWSQEAYVKASNTGLGDDFGISVALSGDGSTLAVGALAEDSAATGINGNQGDNSANNAGAAYVFARSGTTWSQQAYVKASNTGSNDLLGRSVALSADGSILAVGAESEASTATGINGNQADNSALSAGAVYRFVRIGTTWSQQTYVKASNTGTSDLFGWSVALAAGGTLAVGARGESSAATGIGGNQADNSAPQAGAVYVLQ